MFFTKKIEKALYDHMDRELKAHFKKWSENSDGYLKHHIEHCNEKITNMADAFKKVMVEKPDNSAIESIARSLETIVRLKLGPQNDER